MLPKAECRKTVAKTETPVRIFPKADLALWGAGGAVMFLCFCLYGFGDRQLARWFHANLPHYPKLEPMFQLITQLGDSALYLVPAGVCFIVVRFRLMKSSAAPREKLARLAAIALFLFVAIAASGLLTDLLKVLFGRPRPTLFFHEGRYAFEFFRFSPLTWSFPSGHADTIFALATSLYLLAPRGAALYFYVAVIVALSRVAVGAHYPGDVLMGGYLGILTTVYLKRWFLRRGYHMFPPK